MKAGDATHLRRWVKEGLVFSPEQGVRWMRTHAQVPTPLVKDGFVRVYFASRPEATLSLTSFVDLEPGDPFRVRRVHERPLLDIGPPGSFDEHGIMPSCALSLDDRTVYLYYSGWSRGNSVPYVNSTGLAISEDGGETFRKVGPGPLLSKGLYDPYSATSPFVSRDGDEWHMWYCSGTDWVEIDGKLEHSYDIKHASSTDGIHWSPDPTPAIPQGDDREALTRPWVRHLGDRYGMWFCHRDVRDFRDGAGAYRIGYAESNDRIEWRRVEDGGGIDPSETGWDSSTVAYPALVEFDGRVWMFYNGNGFGTEGFGVARCDDEREEQAND